MQLIQAEIASIIPAMLKTLRKRVETRFDFHGQYSE
jgi:hypothetical protein